MSNVNPHEHVWVKHHLEMLEELREYGRVKRVYKHSLYERTCGLVGTGFLSIFCTPCLTWDALCCMVSACCEDGKGCKRGFGTRVIKESYSASLEDKREEILSDVRPHDITAVTMQTVCSEYLKYLKYLENLNEKVKAEGGIGVEREEAVKASLVNIIKTYTVGFEYKSLSDDVDIDRLERIINDLPAYYVMWAPVFKSAFERYADRPFRDAAA